MQPPRIGLVGQHAYSVLEAQDGGGFSIDGDDGRRVKVRNPWGEWTRREQDELLASLGVAISPSDGCFWMNYSDFIRGFACADACQASFFELGAKVLLFRAGLLDYKRLDPASMCMF